VDDFGVGRQCILFFRRAREAGVTKIVIYRFPEHEGLRTAAQEDVADEEWQWSEQNGTVTIQKAETIADVKRKLAAEPARKPERRKMVINDDLDDDDEDHSPPPQLKASKSVAKVDPDKQAQRAAVAMESEQDGVDGDTAQAKPEKRPRDTVSTDEWEAVSLPLIAFFNDPEKTLEAKAGPIADFVNIVTTFATPATKQALSLIPEGSGLVDTFNKYVLLSVSKFNRARFVFPMPPFIFSLTIFPSANVQSNKLRDALTKFREVHPNIYNEVRKTARSAPPTPKEKKRRRQSDLVPPKPKAAKSFEGATPATAAASSYADTQIDEWAPEPSTPQKVRPESGFAYPNTPSQRVYQVAGTPDFKEPPKSPKTTKPAVGAIMPEFGIAQNFTSTAKNIPMMGNNADMMDIDENLESDAMQLDDDPAPIKQSLQSSDSSRQTNTLKKCAIVFPIDLSVDLENSSIIDGIGVKCVDGREVMLRCFDVPEEKLDWNKISFPLLVFASCGNRLSDLHLVADWLKNPGTILCRLSR
jgi:hypothetical protein